MGHISNADCLRYVDVNNGFGLLVYLIKRSGQNTPNLSTSLVTVLYILDTDCLWFGDDNKRFGFLL